MPLYEYDCQGCKDRIVVDHILTDDEEWDGHSLTGTVEDLCGPLKRRYSFGAVYWPQSERGH